MSDLLLQMKIWFYFSPYAALFVFIILSFAQVYAHELGHLCAGKLFGLRDGTIRFGRVKNIESRLWFPQCFFKDADFEKLSLNQRRFVFAGGVLMDGLTTLLIVGAIWLVPMPHQIKEALVGVCILKVLTIVLNIIPIQRFKNDGWRFRNPSEL